MQELTRKYVFHIPLFRYSDDGLVAIDIDDVLGDLIDLFNESGFGSLYVTKVKSHYKSRCFDEVLLTLFCDGEGPEAIFEDWFRKNNDTLKQEAFAFECGNRMYIEEL